MPVLQLRGYTFFGTPIGQTSTLREREKEGKQGKREQCRHSTGWDRNGRASCCHTRVNNNKTCPAWGSAPLRHARDSMGTPGLRRTKPWMHCAIAQLTHGNTLTCKYLGWTFKATCHLVWSAGSARTGSVQCACGPGVSSVHMCLWGGGG
jgi:hypothetical protein